MKHKLKKILTKQKYNISILLILIGIYIGISAWILNNTILALTGIITYTTGWIFPILTSFLENNDNTFDY